MTAERAWEIYRNRGVIPPGYASEIAARRRVQSDWESEGEQLI